MTTLHVVAGGLSATIQDLGRPGLARHGVPPSGAADRAAHLRANALVGNTPAAATAEIVPPGFACRADHDLVVALTGAPAALTVDGAPHPHDSAFVLHAGQTLALGAPEWGLRTYLAVRGGIAVPTVLGSRSTDQLAGLGPPPLAADSVLPVGDDLAAEPWRAPAPTPRPRLPLDVPVLATAGLEWLRGDPLDAKGIFTVGPGSGRTALRLDGEPWTRTREGEFGVQGLVRGAVQVPPDGRPIVFLADHPVTGGYPVVGVVASTHLDRLAQLRPGDALRLVRP
jgi:biotin-dependent carboxylase-like uncharacterized protein